MKRRWSSARLWPRRVHLRSPPARPARTRWTSGPRATAGSTPASASTGTSHGAAAAAAGRKSVAAEAVGLKLVGKADLGGKLGGDGRVADVSAKGNYAYLTMFYEPTCGRGGVQIVDISDPASPVKKGYIPSHVDTYSGEGSQVVDDEHAVLQGRPARLPERVVPGHDQRRRRHHARRRAQPELAEEARRGRRRLHQEGRHAGEGRAADARPTRRTRRSRGTNKETGKVYVVLVDDLEESDVDILDITNPTKPKLVSETNLDQSAQTGPGRPHGDSVFSHDMVVKRIGSRDMMLMSLLGRRLRQARRDRPGSAARRCRTPTSRPLDPAAPSARPDDHAGGQRPPGGVLPRQPVLLRHGRGLRPVPRGRPHSTAARTRATDVHGDPGRRTPSRSPGQPAVRADAASSASRATPVASGAGRREIAVVERGVCDFQVKIDNWPRPLATSR